MKLKEKKPRVAVVLKRPFSYQPSQLRKCLIKFCRNLDFSDTLWFFTAFFGHKQNSKVLNDTKQKYHPILPITVISLFKFCSYLLIFNFVPNSLKIWWGWTCNMKT
jgi:hypothetical protein